MNFKTLHHFHSPVNGLVRHIIKNRNIDKSGKETRTPEERARCTTWEGMRMIEHRKIACLNEVHLLVIGAKLIWANCIVGMCIEACLFLVHIQNLGDTEALVQFETSNHC